MSDPEKELSSALTLVRLSKEKSIHVYANLMCVLCFSFQLAVLLANGVHNANRVLVSKRGSSARAMANAT